MSISKNEEINVTFDRKDTLEYIKKSLPVDLDFLIINPEKNLKPRLCMARIQKNDSLPYLVSQVEKDISTFKKAHPKHGLRNSKNYIFMYETEKKLELEKYIKEIFIALNNFLFSDIVFFNSMQDNIKSLSKLVNFREYNSQQLSYNILSETISKTFDVNIEVFRVGPNDGVSSLCADHVYTAETAQKLEGRAKHSIASGRVIEVDSAAGIDIDLFKYEKFERVYIFPIRTISQGIVAKSDFALISSKGLDPIDLFKINCIDSCIEDYIYTRSELGKLDCLFWQTEQMTRITERHDVDQIDHEKIFQKYINQLANYVLNSTQAHSFSFLEYDGKNKSLQRRVVVSEPPPAGEGQQFKSSGEPISLRRRDDSLSVHLFNNWHNAPHRFVYISDIRDRAKIAQLAPGLNTVSCERNRAINRREFEGARTIAEIAIIVQDQDMPVGVVCVESPYEDGLKSDQLFLRQIVGNASIFWTFLFRANDQLWLKRNLQLQDISHGLSKLVLSLEEGRAKNELAELTHRLSANDQESQLQQSFKDRLDAMLWREAGKSSYLYDEVASLVGFFNPDRHQVPRPIQMAAIQIVRDLLRNRTHAKTPQPISLATRDEYGGARNVLVIRTSLHLQLPGEEIQDAFRRPIRRAQRDHVGLYMIGVIARTWGGRVDFDRSIGVLDRELEICIPFGKRGGERD